MISPPCKKTHLLMLALLLALLPIACSGENADDHYHNGMDRFDAGDYAGAIAHFDKAIELDPEDRDAYLQRGISYLMQGNEEEAQRDFDKCYEMDPDLQGKLQELIDGIKAKQDGREE